MATARGTFFERKATGLVREAGTWSTLIYNINFISIGLMMMFVIQLEPSFYPGGDMIGSGCGSMNNLTFVSRWIPHMYLKSASHASVVHAPRLTPNRPIGPPPRVSGCRYARGEGRARPRCRPASHPPR